MLIWLDKLYMNILWFESLLEKNLKGLMRDLNKRSNIFCFVNNFLVLIFFVFKVKNILSLLFFKYMFTCMKKYFVCFTFFKTHK